VGHETPVSDQVSDNGTEHSGISAPGPGRLATGKIIKRRPSEVLRDEAVGHPSTHRWTLATVGRPKARGPAPECFGPLSRVTNPKMASVWQVLVSGGGFEGDSVAECFKLADVVAFLGVGVDVSVVVVDAEVVEPGVGVGKEVPDDHQQ
jgi:hypothetical protein